MTTTQKKEVCGHGHWRKTQWDGYVWVSSHKYWCEQGPLPKPKKGGAK